MGSKHKLLIEFPEIGVSVEIELDEVQAPKTVQAILEKLPIEVEINRWGDELYTEPMPVKVREKENARSLVDLMDVAYWPEGDALCLFFGPTPISKGKEIKPYSPVNVIGKILGKENLAKRVQDSTPMILRTS
ncbi:MAG: cyclophilin-like fold protein [Nitrososphaerales archaeon]